MLEVTKKRRTDGFVAVSAVVSADRVQAVERAILDAVAPNVPADEVLGDVAPGVILRGARGVRGLTQAQLAGLVGIQKSHVSEMERGVRTIGKAMAKRLAEALDMPYKAFL